MYLCQFTVRNFRSYRSLEELRLDPHLTLLAGRNNVGKTAMLRALQLLRQTQPDTPRDIEIAYTWHTDPAEITQAFDHPDGPHIAERLLQMLHGLDVIRLYARFEHRAPDTRALPHNTGLSRLNAQHGEWFLVESGIVDSRLRMVPHWNPQSNNLQWWWAEPDKLDGLPLDTLLGYWWELILDATQRSFYFSPRRASTEGTAYQPTFELAPDGHDLPNHIATLFINKTDTAFRELERFMLSAFPDIARIRIDMSSSPAPRIDIGYGTRGQFMVPLHQCGTGIEQLLMLAAVILAAPTPKLLLIDEPHAFLHPSAERSLLQLIRQHPEHQYVVATHSGVFLNAAPLAQTRLITIGDAGSHVTDVGDKAAILDAIGITAADLWSADALLWIEGPSDVEAVTQVIASLEDTSDVSVEVRAMPDWMRSAAASRRNATGAAKFYDSVSSALSPVKVPSLFVFDGDEKEEPFRHDIETAMSGRARFLTVRELENMFLVPAAVHPVLSDLCGNVGARPPTVEEVAEDLQSFLAETGNTTFYKHPVSRPDMDRAAGSQVLNAIWRKWATADYSKATYAQALAKQVCIRAPEKLEPIRGLLRELASDVRHGRQPS